MAESPKPAVKEGPTLPVVALIISVVGLCMPPLLLVSLGLGAYAWLRGDKEPAWAARRQLAQMAMVVSAVGALVFAGIALPNVKRVQLRMKQMECRDVLQKLGDAEKQFYAKNSRYTTSLQELDPKAVRGTKLIRLAGEGPLWTDGALGPEHVGSGFDTVLVPNTSTAAVDKVLPVMLRDAVGLKGTCPACTLTILCAAELDGDPTADVWTYSTVERIGTGGAKIPGGMPWNEVDDAAQ